jgi:hypothetical protein
MNNHKTSSRKPLKAIKVVKSRTGKSIIHIRRLKVSSQSVACRSSNNGLKNIPFLRLTGVWLDEVGFRIDSKVDIIVDDNLLIIKPSVVQ